MVLQDDFLWKTSREYFISSPRCQWWRGWNRRKGAYVTEFTDRFDEGLDTLIGERGVKLSGDNVNISNPRAFWRTPGHFNEATSNLDTESERFIQESLEINDNRTTLVIATA